MSPLHALAGKRIVVFGGAGFIGRHVVDQARSAGAQVYTVDRRGTGVDRTVDLGVTEASESLLAWGRALQPALVVNAAGIANWSEKLRLGHDMVDAHMHATHRALRFAQETGARVCLIGSAGEYGAAPAPQREEQWPLPLDTYSVTKLASTELGLMFQRAAGVFVTVVRPFQVYGPGEAPGRLVPSLFLRAVQGRSSVDLSPGEQLRDFIYVGDVAEGILRSVISDAADGQVLNLGTGVTTSVRQLVTKACELSGNVVEPRFGALPYRPGEPMTLCADTTRIEALLGWKPRTSVAEGLAKTWAALSRAQSAR